MAYATLLMDVKDSVACITLNRPEAHNPLNLQLGRRGQAALSPDVPRPVRNTEGGVACRSTKI